MKEFWTRLISNGALLLLIIAVLYIIFLRECKKPEPCPAKDEIIIKKIDWQSMIDIANKPAKHDTVWVKGDIVYVPTTPDNPLPQPKPELKDSTNTYADSLVNKEIYVHYDFKVKGTLLSRDWNYRPVIERITDSIPYPVYVKGDPYEVKVSQRGLYIYGSAGGNDKAFLFGGGLDFITKKDTELGYLYQRFGNQNFHNIKVGVKLFNKYK
jgi:hypothetical protein